MAELIDEFTNVNIVDIPATTLYIPKSVIPSAFMITRVVYKDTTSRKIIRKASATEFFAIPDFDVCSIIKELLPPSQFLYDYTVPPRRIAFCPAQFLFLIHFIDDLIIMHSTIMVNGYD